MAETWRYGTILDFAVRRRDVKAVELLVEYGANPELLNDLGETALHKAASLGHLKIVRIFLEYGVDHWLKNAEGETPVSYAVRSRRGAAVRLLVQNNREFLVQRFFEVTPPAVWGREPARTFFSAKGLNASRVRKVALMR